MIPVNKPFLPPQEEYQSILNEIWKRNWLTNQGPLVQDLEKQLQAYLGLNNLSFVTNGTIALQIAIKALELKGEVITTPFSFIATTSSLLWEKCTPVFADIDPDTWNISIDSIEKLITPKTTAILATHVFGNPCDIEGIQVLREKYNLKIIYDAAHCFGVKYKEQSILNFGDISTISFHATKLYHTIEGGGIVSTDLRLRETCKRLMNFGFTGPYTHEYVGINGKNSEFNAAMGLCNLKYIEKILQKRKTDYSLYQSKLKSPKIKFQFIDKQSVYNYAYVPIVFETEEMCEVVLEKLTNEDIHPRKYFRPSLNTLPFVPKHSCPISEDITNRILCMPQYHELSAVEIDRICFIINSAL